ncbi:MAG: helix-turn-helix domain-containing protein [Tannerella sp.]|jgi:hypothetical protein|nr:helix-turn-helix domain-containing protein [Tannerella sp.]
MYVDNEIFEKWMTRLDGRIGKVITYLKSFISTNEVFDKDEKLLDNTDLCFMLHVSKWTLLRYRREGKLPYILLEQKIYYKNSDVREFIERTGNYWDKKAIDNVL